jgi:hypothetical protein
MDVDDMADIASMTVVPDAFRECDHWSFAKTTILANISLAALTNFLRHHNLIAVLAMSAMSPT